MNETKDLRLYILMRTDLQSMCPGRCMAQASHATSVLEKIAGNKKEVREWKNQTPSGFGTCIVLGATVDEIDHIFQDFKTNNFNPIWGWVDDPDYVVRVTHEIANFMRGDIQFIEESADENTIGFTRSESTCAFVLGTKEELEPYLGELELY